MAWYQYQHHRVFHNCFFAKKMERWDKGGYQNKREKPGKTARKQKIKTTTRTMLSLHAIHRLKRRPLKKIRPNHLNVALMPRRCILLFCNRHTICPFSFLHRTNKWTMDFYIPPIKRCGLDFHNSKEPLQINTSINKMVTKRVRKKEARNLLMFFDCTWNNNSGAYLIVSCTVSKVLDQMLPCLGPL